MSVAHLRNGSLTGPQQTASLNVPVRATVLVFKAPTTQCCMKTLLFPHEIVLISWKRITFKGLIFGGDFETIIKATEVDVPDTQQAKCITQQFTAPLTRSLRLLTPRAAATQDCC